MAIRHSDNFTLRAEGTTSMVSGHLSCLLPFRGAIFLPLLIIVAIATASGGA